MNTTEYLFTCLAEECAEAQQLVAKILRFGLDDVWPNPAGNPQGLNNHQRLTREVNDLLAVLDLLGEQGVAIPRQPELVQAKKERLWKYMAYSREVGTLVDPPKVL